MTSTMIPMMANTICTTISPMVSPFLVAILARTPVPTGRR